MKKYRVFWNAHRYVDCSDKPQVRCKTVKAESPGDAWDLVAVWRLSLPDRRFAETNATYRYVGMVHSSGIEEVARSAIAKAEGRCGGTPTGCDCGNNCG